MCLIINKPANVKFTRDELRNFWMRNSDGAGIMWYDGDGVNVEKITAPTFQQWVDFYNAHAANRACVIHLRMRTHGDINEENTHPYYVGRGYFLMHNGVLSTGNAADTTKSDTWHFIRDSLRPAMRKAPRCLENPTFTKKLGSIIGGSNRLAILGPSGKVVLVNKHSGIMHKGAWFSNTYAWDAPVRGHTFYKGHLPTPKRYHDYTYSTAWNSTDDSEDYESRLGNSWEWDTSEAVVVQQPAQEPARKPHVAAPRPVRDQRAPLPKPMSAYVRQMSLLHKGE